jgi:hypothetical protein
MNESFFRPTFDLGQLITGGIIGLLGWLIKREIARITTKIEAHDKMFFDLNSHVQRLIGRDEGLQAKMYWHKRDTDNQ